MSGIVRLTHDSRWQRRRRHHNVWTARMLCPLLACSESMCSATTLTTHRCARQTSKIDADKYC